MMPLAVVVAKSLGKRINKAVVQSAKIEGILTTYFSEIIKTPLHFANLAPNL